MIRYLFSGSNLKNYGNENFLCAHASLTTGEIRSFYCDMFGRYVNIVRATSETLDITDIIVNPETTG